MVPIEKTLIWKKIDIQITSKKPEIKPKSASEPKRTEKSNGIPKYPRQVLHNVQLTSYNNGYRGKRVKNPFTIVFFHNWNQ